MTQGPGQADTKITAEMVGAGAAVLDVALDGVFLAAGFSHPTEEIAASVFAAMCRARRLEASSEDNGNTG